MWAPPFNAIKAAGEPAWEAEWVEMERLVADLAEKSVAMGYSPLLAMPEVEQLEWSQAAIERVRNQLTEADRQTPRHARLRAAIDAAIAKHLGLTMPRGDS